MRVADYLIETLVKKGVGHIFTVSGRGTLYLTDAIAKCDGMEAVCVHNEQAGSYAAVAYAKCNENLGACLLTTGCGSTNAISGVLCAWQDEVPCVFISGQNMLNETVSYTNAQFRTFGSQEAEIVSLVRPVTKYAVMLTDAKQAVYEFEKALYLATEGKRGPVWIDVPLDIQNARIEPGELYHFEPTDDANKAVKVSDIDLLVELLTESHRPALLTGNGVRASGAIELLDKFVSKTGIPVTYAHTASDIYGLDKEMSMGCVGSLCGTRAGNFTVQNADLLIVLGCRMTSMTTGSQPEKFAREAKTVVIDIDRDEHTKNTFHIDYFIEADVKDLLGKLISTDLKPVLPDWKSLCLHWKEIFPKCEDKYKQSEKVDLYYLSEVLSKKMIDNTCLVCDAGLEELLLPANVVFREGTRCIQPAMQGAMGFALPGAIGAACLDNGPVIAVIGDGSFMMNLQELQTIHYNKFPIKILVTNNNAYAVIRQRQKELFRTRTIGTDIENGLECANFEKIAEAFDIPYMRISSTKNLEDGIDEFISMDGSVLCEVMCVEDQKYLRTAYTKTKSRKYVQRPLEDQEPFLDRDIFLKEMVIEPIDQ
ncbi:MAG: thiamine pyrophosphate-binding protein [Lachnospiraceae bacterium]|nr:thiamine pyrophosphate-binding protein [Lachnospiraceae bacterium]